MTSRQKNNLSKFVLYFLTIMGMFVAAIINAFYLDSFLVTFLILLLFIIAGFVLWAYMQDPSFLKTKIKDNMSYIESTSTLKLYKCVPSNGSEVKIHKIYNAYLQYHPEEYVYTGASSGGIHMGGIQKFEAYNTVNGVDSGKYRLEYRYPDDNVWHIVRKIELDESLIESAKMNPNISKYMDKNGVLILQNEVTKQIRNEIGEAFKTGNMLLIQKAGNKAALTKEECQKILDWICDR